MSEEKKDNKFFVTTGKHLKEHGYTSENRPTIKLNPSEVPAGLRSLIPLAEYWGVSDDIIRYDIIEKASTERLQDLVETICKPDIDDELDEWLAGPEAEAQESSEAYIAFTALRLAAEEAQSFLQKRQIET